ncbi:MAG: alpha/beta fold hydrolase, partial [Chloroflexi bacterium]|nr:alpha/beta fold hydrolase [Chloroflexota bacterium]
MRVKINGISINYRLTGQGKTLVLTHGLGGSLAAWQDLAPEMSRHYQVLTWDVRGFGESD